MLFFSNYNEDDFSFHFGVMFFLFLFFSAKPFQRAASNAALDYDNDVVDRDFSKSALLRRNRMGMISSYFLWCLE